MSFDAFSSDDVVFSGNNPSLTGTNRTLDESLFSTSLIAIQERFQSALSSPDALEWLGGIFDLTDYSAVEALISDPLESTLFSRIEVLEAASMDGALGGYSAKNDTIYLSDDLLGTDQLLSSVLAEEIGHRVDVVLNGTFDTSGDEGALFSSALWGEELSEIERAYIQSEDDTGTLIANGQTMLVERNSLSFGVVALGDTELTSSFSLSQTYTEIFYSISALEDVNLNLTLTGLSANADVQLLNNRGRVLQNSSRRGTNNETISRELSVGDYSVRVYAPRTGDVDYTLDLEFASQSQGPNDNSIGSAQNLGNLARSRRINDSIGTSDANDYYRFSLNDRSDFALALSGLSGNASVELLNSRGATIASSTNRGTNAENIGRTLESGDYFVRVFPNKNNLNTNYTLDLSASIAEPPDLAGNSTRNARNIGKLSGARTFSDIVSNNDTDDYYRFRLSESSEFDLSLSGLSANANVQLLNNRGNVVATSTQRGTRRENISEVLGKGNYFVQVNYPGNKNSSTEYTLDLSATAVPRDFAGNSLEDARNVGRLGSMLRTFDDFVGRVDSNDFYRFNLDRTSDFSLALSGLSANANVELLNSQGSVVTRSTKRGTRAESIRQTLDAGEYFTRVYPGGSSSDTNYILNLSATENDPGNIIARARKTGVLDGNLILRNSVSDDDRFDYYQFKLDSISNFTVKLDVDSSRYDADVKIVDARGVTVYNPGETNNFDEVGETLLEEGVYYALVSENGFRGSTNYELSLEANAITNNIPRRDPGNTTARATNLGKLGATQTLNAFVSDSDRFDYYRFELDSISNFTIDLEVDSSRYDADVRIVDASGATVYDPGETNNFDEVGETLLEEGVYYALVSENGFNNGTAYTLQMAANPIRNNTPASDPGETTARATNLGKLGATQTLNAFVSDSDRFDYYRFELDSISNFTIDLEVDSSRYDADVRIVDASGATVYDPGETNNFDEVGETLLEEGVYYALVSENGFSNGTAYTLQMAANPIRNNTPASDPGETTARATNLGKLGATQTLNAFVSDADRTDYYKFRVGGTNSVRIDLDVSSDRYDADVVIVDELGATVFNPRETNGLDEFGVVRLQGGTYYAVVTENGFNGGTEYKLELGIS